MTILMKSFNILATRLSVLIIQSSHK